MQAERSTAQALTYGLTFLVVAVALTVLLANVTDWPRGVRLAVVVVVAGGSSALASSMVRRRGSKAGR